MKFGLFLGLSFHQLITLMNVNGQNVQSAEPPEHVGVTVSSPINHKVITIKTLKLQRDSFLANQNLPVWIAHAQNPNILERLTQVMEDIGPLSMYHGEGNCAAGAVYSYRRQQFDGAIGPRLILHKAHYDPQTNQVALSPHANPFGRHPPVILEPENPSGVYEEEGQKMVREHWKYVQSRLPYPETVYIEILVVVNHDVAESYGYNFTSIVYDILVLFNTVDALYSRAETPKIKINVAGIIIGKEMDSFPELLKENCYQQYNENAVGLYSNCAIEAIRSFLHNHYKTITIHDYDAVIFFSRKFIGENLDADNQMKMSTIGGHATLPVRDDGSYEGYKSSPSHVRVALITIDGTFYFYPSTVAHELAHLLNAYHDQGDFRAADGTCTSNIMRTRGDECTKCFYFSDDTLKQFTHFFSSRDGCIFRNKPKSLNGPSSRPKLFLDQDQQCQCYGYEHAYKPPKKCFNCVPILRKERRICENKLQCVRLENGVKFVDDTTFLMDGTPCGRHHKVCWNFKCE